MLGCIVVQMLVCDGWCTRQKLQLSHLHDTRCSLCEYLLVRCVRWRQKPLFRRNNRRREKWLQIRSVSLTWIRSRCPQADEVGEGDVTVTPNRPPLEVELFLSNTTNVDL